MRKITLFMLMAVGLLISGNVRADKVCKIDNTEYPTLTEAIAAVADDAETTIEMIADDVIEEALTTSKVYEIPKNKKIIIELNGHTISRYCTEGGRQLFHVEGSLTIKNSVDKQGLVNLEVNSNARKDAVYVVDVDYEGIFTLEGGELRMTMNCNGGVCYAINALRNATINIHGGLIQNTKITAIRLLPNADGADIERTTHFNMTGGEIRGVYGIYVCNNKNCAHYDVHISGGEINTSKIGDREQRWCFQDCIEASNVSTAGDVLEISGGTFNSWISIAEPDIETCSIDPSKRGTYTISGGTFTGTNGVRVFNNETGIISGGQYFFEKGNRTEELALEAPILFTSDEQGPVGIGNLGYRKYRGELATKEGWTALGYILHKDTKQEGEWYYVYRQIQSNKDFSKFQELIADGYMAVDISGQDDGNSGTYPEKTVEIKKVEEVTLSGTQDWTSDKTDETKAVTIEAGANITIPAGTTVEAYSVTVPTGTNLNVENGATLIVGAGGVTTATGEEEISINIGSNDGSGAIKISPDAPVDKAQPRVRIKLTTIAHRDAQGNSHWQYFARPTGMRPESFTVVEAAGATEHYIRGYVGSSDSYIDITEPSQFENYEGYAITNNSTNGGVIYQFEGKLNANQNAKIMFKNNGFSLMGNSYLAPVSVKGLFTGIIEGATAPEAPATAPIAYKAPMEDGGNTVEWTIWIYNCANQRFEQTNTLLAIKNKTQLQPMQGFFMKLREGTSLDAAIDYVGAVWNNNAQAGPILAPARNENEMGAASIIVSANGNADQIDLFEDAEFDNTFNNGADASKLMNLQGMFNLYAQTEAGTLSCVASDNIEGTILTFQANNASEYELSFNGVENMNYSLIDLFNGEIIEMNESNVYKFNAVPNSTEARFQIVEGYKAPTAMEKVNNVKAVKGIYSVTGAYIGEVKNFNALPAGIYIVNGQQIVK